MIYKTIERIENRDFHSRNTNPLFTVITDVRDSLKKYFRIIKKTSCNIEKIPTKKKRSALQVQRTPHDGQICTIVK